MPTAPRKLSTEQHHVCAERIALLEDLALLCRSELAAVYGASSLVARAAQAAVDALANLRTACQQQAREDWPRASYIAQHYKPPPRAPRSG